MAKTDTAPHLLVVIDHQEAKVYRTEVHGAVPLSIAPYDPHGYRKHLHSAHEWTDGKRQPERTSFYEAIAKTLRGAEQVLLFGSGTGRSSAMEMLLADLKTHHPDVAEKIIGSSSWMPTIRPRTNCLPRPGISMPSSTGSDPP